MNDKPVEEASASMRAMARIARDMFAALLAEGFTEAQALALVGTMIAAAVQKPSE